MTDHVEFALYAYFVQIEFSFWLLILVSQFKICPIMVEICKVIAFIPLLDQILDDKNKNGSVKGANYNQLYTRGNLT